MKQETQSEFNQKIMAGLHKAYYKLIDYKRDRKSVLVLLRDKKIVFIKP